MSRNTGRTRLRAAALASALTGALLPGVLAGPPAAAVELGEERYRPELHYTPERNWINDPNGMVYHEGVWHLFYQHNPYGDTWGNMSWGHAVSTDLLSWEEQPVAIESNENEDVFSGSVVVDHGNTSGFGNSEDPPLVAIYTSAFKPASGRGGIQAQSLAYSVDDGATWARYENNPVLDRGSANFRDPKVFWYDGPTEDYWVMVAVEATDYKVVLYKSADLKNWQHLSDFGPANATTGIWECPDLFPIAVDGDPNNIKWVMIVNINPGGPNGGSGGQYFVGDFDGTTFTAESIVGPGELPPGTPLASFDDGTFDEWTIQNEPGNEANGPWGTAPATNTLSGQNTVSGYVGGYLNGFHGGDWPIGTASSQPFTIEQSYVNFLVGGGRHPHVDGAGDGTPPEGDLLFEGFEYPDGTTLADVGWESTGDLTATSQPATQGGEFFIGAKRLNTFETGTVPGDDNQGTLTSPPFTITRDNLSMLVGGGFRSETSGQVLEIQLLVGDQVVQRLAGNESGALNWKGWDVSEFVGQQGRIRVVDQATGGWGHLTADHMILSDAPAQPRSDETAVNLVIDGEVVRTATGANSESLDWASWDVREFAGREARIEVVDRNRGGWGHVLADQFMVSDRPALSRLTSYDWLDWGRDYYATVTFSNAPDDRRITLGWMNNWDYANQIPTGPWRGAMTLPRELALQTIDGEPSLVQQPVAELLPFEQPDATTTVPGGDIPEGQTRLEGIEGSVAKLDVVLEAGTAERFGVVVRAGEGEGTRIGYNLGTQQLILDRTQSGDTSFSSLFASVEEAPLRLPDGRLALTVYLDASSVEVFAQGGEVTMTDQVFPDPSSRAVEVYAEGGSARLVSLELTPLRPAMYAPVTPPGAPTDLRVTSSRGIASVSWAAPTEDGNGGALEYRVTAATEGKGKKPGTTTEVCVTDATTCDVSGLDPGATYRFSVVAVNEAGASEPSASVTAKIRQGR